MNIKNALAAREINGESRQPELASTDEEIGFGNFARIIAEPNLLTNEAR
jgi:hypothetical protein